jgi:hypothetical protein
MVLTNGIEDQEINPHSYSHLIFDKGAKITNWRRDIFYNKQYWENWTSTFRRLKLDPSLSHCKKSNQYGSKASILNTQNFETAIGNT